MDFGLLFVGELFLFLAAFLKTFFVLIDLPVRCLCFAMQRVIFFLRGASLHRRVCDVIFVLYAGHGRVLACYFVK